MADYPDYTRAHQIIGSDIMVPIDVQAAYIMMPIDIQAQYVTLEIDIVAQSVGAIEVNVTAMDVGTIDIDVVAQTVGDITISIDAQNIGVQLKPDWETAQGHQKYFSANGTNVSGSSATYTNYEVPEGKTLYITHLGAQTSAHDSGDFGTVYACYASLYNVTQSTPLVQVGGPFGASMTFPTPIKVPTGETVRISVMSRATFNVDQNICAGGYEV